MPEHDRLAHGLLALIGLSSIAILALVILFIFKEGLPAFTRLGLWPFLTGTRWSPGKGFMGILPMIIGSVFVTAGSLLIGLPLGLGCAIYLSEFAPPRTAALLKPTIELLAGIPSVVFGFIGLTLIVPLVRIYFGGPGFSVLASAIVLGIMVLPTVVGISFDALRAVPAAYREGLLALGANDWQVVKMVVLPAARPGIVAAVILAVGRVVGETMAVIMVAGNATIIPASVLDPVRTLTSNIALEMGYATGLHRSALFATGIVLFVIVSILNAIARAAARGK